MSARLGSARLLEGRNDSSPLISHFAFVNNRRTILISIQLLLISRVTDVDSKEPQIIMGNLFDSCTKQQSDFEGDSARLVQKDASSEQRASSNTAERGAKYYQLIIDEAHR
jgi:hypothetical protein